MADLNINTRVNVGPVEQLGTAAKDLGSDLSNLAQRFVESGMTAKDAESALVNLGYSAKQAATAISGLTAATALANEEMEVTTGRVDAMTRALAYSAARLAANELGVGQLGFALARVGSVSSALAPILSVAFPIFGAVALLDIIGNLVDKYETWARLGMETTRHMNDLNISIQTQTDKIELDNAKLQNQIDILGGGLGASNKLAIDALESKIAFEELGKAIDDDLDKINKFLRSGYGPMSELFAGKANVKAVGEMLEPYERQYQAALLQNDKQGQLNALLNEQIALQRIIAEEKAKQPTETPGYGPRGAGIGRTVGRGPDLEAIQQYSAALAAVESLKQRIYDLEQKGALTGDRDKLKTENDIAKLALAEHEEEGRYEKEKLKDIDEEIKLMDELRRAGLPTGLVTTMHKPEIEELISLQKQADAEWRRIVAEEEAESRAQAAEAIRLNADVFKEKERLIEEGARVALGMDMEEVRSIEEQARAHQISRSQELVGLQEIRNKLELQKEATRDLLQMQIAAEAAGQASGKFGPQGSPGFEASANRQLALQKQLDELMKQFDRDIQTVTNTTDKLDTSWTTFFQKMHTNVMDFATNFRMQMENSINSVNTGMANAVTQWISYNKSFGDSMKNLGVQILNSFVNMFVQLGLQWLETQIFMLITGKSLGASSAASRVVQEAAVAGASGTASWAAAPWPIDALAPEFGSAMFGAALSYVGLAAAAKGGVFSNDQLTMVHAKEMVLPPHISSFLQSAAGGTAPQGTTGGGSSLGGVHIHYAPTINGGADRDLLSGHAGHIATMVRRELRRMNLT